jgi:hypothetical protein
MNVNTISLSWQARPMKKTLLLRRSQTKCNSMRTKLVSFKYLVASTLFLQYPDVLEYSYSLSLSLSLSLTHTHTHKCLDIEIADIIVEPM